MDILFVISHVPNPRMNKRMQVAKEIGNTGVIYWDRGTVKIWDVFHADISNIKLSIKANYTNPLKRIIPTFKFGVKAIKEIARLKPKSLYVANIDMLIIASLYAFGRKNKPKIIYEIADLNQLIADSQTTTLKKFMRMMLVYLEKKLCQNISTLVVTSEKFYEHYYSKFVPKSKLLFFPNIPNLEAFKNYSKTKNEKFTVGFIGAIRYKNQMKMLIEAAEKSNVNILFAGAGLDDEIQQISKEKNFIKYSGRYNYEKEIASLYQQVDAIYSVYDADLNNVKLALPNKLYESIYCELPIIVAKGTYLSEIVTDKGVGVAVDHNNSLELQQELDRLSNNQNYYDSILIACRDNKNDINIKLYNEKLAERLNAIIL
ncbi:glycosyltransferase [Paenibacillus albus]|uniref:Glycosyltransferase n=1 Tax=Paenibacillus albus TaxID=2495582 RepID=A0A3Q8X305_9BACL|nr:glycosyltransferase [Paenibacillus albus]AZN38584.1 glycosyltransferase [Paenibacillus albus]